DPGSFTGKSMKRGGSEGREAATGRGGVIVLAEYLKAHGLAGKPLTVALQGFGNVGYFFAKVLQEEYPELRLIAVSNSKHTWVRPAGIDVTNTASATPRPEDLADIMEADALPAEAIIGVKADILVLAALENAITKNNMEAVLADIIVELANGPITEQAEAVLLARSADILPDVVANAGGVIVSYLEWQQNLAGAHWPEAEVNQKLADILVSAAQAMFRKATEKRLSYKQAAFEIALERLLGEAK
ncbi:MAG TPA: hypothetical protein VKQ34_04200, partial [Candidatus Saccharimonadales bacterium]|nr:hypothetical protein [Candidatus Saccharimonadales bacterium]